MGQHALGGNAVRSPPPMVYHTVLEQVNYVLIFMALFSALRVDVMMMDVPLFYFIFFLSLRYTVLSKKYI